MFYKEILEQTGPRSAFLEHLEAQILKNFLAHPKNSGYVTAYRIWCAEAVKEEAKFGVGRNSRWKWEGFKILYKVVAVSDV